MKHRILLCILAIFSVARLAAVDGPLSKPAPAITAGSANGIISACTGSASASPNIQHFTASGGGLTANITVTAPASFEVSLSAGSGYGASVTLTPSGGTVNSTTIYVRSAASAAIGNLSGSVVLSSAGAANQNVAVTGKVHALPTVNAVPNQTVVNGTATLTTNFAGTASYYSWTNDKPGIGLPASGVDNITSFTAVNAGTTPITATITVTPEYKTSLYAYIPDAYNGNVLVVNTATNKIVATIPVGLSPFGVVVTPDASRVYVTNFEANTVSVINTATNAVTATITVATQPRGIAMSPDGSRVYVISGVAANMTVINTATNTVVNTIPVGSTPNDAVVSADGTRVYVNSLLGGISVFDTATLTQTGTIQDASAFGLAVNPNGSWLYATDSNTNSVSVINTATNLVIATIPVGTGPFAISISSDGNLAYVTNTKSNNVSVINLTTNTVIATIPVGTSPRGVSVSPDNSQVYVTNPDSFNINVISAATNTVTSTITLDGDPVAFGNFITAGPGCSGTPTKFTITVNPSLVGTAITASGATGSITSCAGTPSASPNIQQFTVSGTKLSANITATAPAGFQVSLVAGSGYSSSVSIAPVSGTVTSTQVYVRSSASASGHIVGNVVLTSAGATSQDVLVTGTAKPLPSVNPVQNQTVAKGTATAAVNFAGNASSFTWVNNTPAIGLAASGTGNIASFTATNGGATPLTATVTVTPVPVQARAYIPNYGSNNVSVINTTTNAVVATIPVGTGPTGVAVSPDGALVYIANQNSNNVSVISTKTNTVVATITVEQLPTSVAISPDGSRVYVLNSYAFLGTTGTLSVIDAATNTVITSIAVGTIPGEVRVSPDGSKVYVANTFDSTVQVIDAATNTTIVTLPTVAGTYIVGAFDMASSPDGSRLYVTGSINNHLYVVNTINNTVAAPLTVGTTPSGVLVSPDGSKVYVSISGANNVLVLNAITNAVLATIPVGTQPAGLSQSPDGSLLYVVNETSNNVSVINTATNAVIATIPVGTTPLGYGNFILGGSNCTGTPITFTITVSPGTPVITVTGTLTALTTAQGTASSSTSFKISGANMAAGIAVTPPPGFEVSTDNATFSSSVTVGSGGTIALTTVYVRLSAAAAVGTYSGNIVLSSAAATNVNEATAPSTVTGAALPGQTITFGPIPAKTYGNADFAPGATASSGLPVSYTSSNTAVATIVGGKIHIVGAGTSNITASQAGNANFSPAANVIQLLTVNPAAQTITFAALAPVNYGAADITPTVSASSGLAVTLSSDNTAVATIVGGKIHIVGGGTANITASQAGNGNYAAAADVIRLLTVNKLAQTITFAALAPVTYGAADITPSVSASSGLAVTLTSSNTAVATIVSGKIHIAGAGTANITASQPGDANYAAAANVVRPLTVNKATQTITFPVLNPVPYGIADFTPTASASSGLAITFTSSNLAVATIVNNQVHITGVGTANITASQPGNAGFSAAADVTRALTVSIAAQTITFAAIGTKNMGDTDFDPGATSSSGFAVTYTSSNTAVAIIVSGKIHIVGPGTSTITASQAGNADYAAAPNVQQVLTVVKKSQTITFAAIGTKDIDAADFDPGATASSGLAITYTSSNTAVATIVAGKVHIVGAGASTITASQAGNGVYAAATSVQQLLTVVKKPQTITFAALPSKVAGDVDFDPGATASSGLTVSYSSSNIAVATIVSGEIHIIGPGTADITASQGGNATYAAATDVTQTLTVADIVHNVVITHPVVTPNGDAINQVLKFDGLDNFPNNKVVLVNANGVKIYEQAGYDNASKAFDGHSNISGTLQQAGTYFYMVEYTENGATKRLKGYFVIKY